MLPASTTRNDAIWHLNFGRLVSWREVNPDRWPSARTDDGDERVLGAWLHNQKHAKKTGTKGWCAARAQLMDQAFPGWTDGWDVKWSRRLDALKHWRRLNPGRWPSPHAIDSAEAAVGVWLSHQRNLSKRGAAPWSAEREAALSAVGKGWLVTTDERWESALAELDSWRKQSSGAWPSMASVDAKEARLGRWLGTQRNLLNSASLLSHRKELLDRRMPGWSTQRSGQWQRNLDELIQWRECNSGKWPSQIGEDDQERRLGRWLTAQRVAQKGRGRALSAERESFLDNRLDGWKAGNRPSRG